LPEPLAEAGAGSSTFKCVLDIGSDLPLPRWGVLSGKSLCTSRRWRLFFVQFQPRDSGKKYLVGREMCTVQLAITYLLHQENSVYGVGSVLCFMSVTVSGLSSDPKSFDWARV
jgi:hypothetical protein